LSSQERGDMLLMRWRLQRAAGIPANLRLPEDVGPLRLRGKPNADQLKAIAATLRETYKSRDLYLMAAAAWCAIADLSTSPASPKMPPAPMVPAQIAEPVPAHV
jgi:hypothetical protein